MKQKKFKDLNLNNAFLFAAALSDEETCGLVLELILGKKFSKICVKSEHAVMFSSEFRSVRLDIYARDDAEVSYNLEMQNENEGNLPKRARYHQAEMDVTSLKPGENFNDLKPSYVIFICTFDPFGKKLYRYTFEERCMERDIPLGDETAKIFLSTKGENQGEVPEILVQFLKYVENSTDAYVKQVTDDRMKRLHDKIQTLKKSRELEAGYMWMEEYLRNEINRETKKAVEKAVEKEREKAAGETAEAVAEATEAGRNDGQQRMLTLISCMIKDGSQDMLPKLTEDEQFFEEMLQKYNL